MTALREIIGRIFGAPEDTAGPGSGGRPRPDPVVEAAAALLIEAATVDGRFGPDEERTIAARLRERFGIGDAGLHDVMVAARAEVERSGQLFGFTQRIVAGCSDEEREQLVELLWDVAYADGTVHDFEAALIRRVCGLLHVTDRASGAARKRAEERRNPSG